MKAFFWSDMNFADDETCNLAIIVQMIHASQSALLRKWRKMDEMG